MPQINFGLKLFDLDKLLDTLTGYIETKIELLKLDAKEELSAAMIKLAVLLLVAACILLAIAFLSFGIASLLNQYLDSSYLGFVGVGGLYLILAALVYSQKEAITSRLKRQTTEELNMEDSE